MTWHEKLATLNPCSDALEWAKQYPTVQEAWGACERGDWLAWFAARVGLTPERHRQLVLAAADIAETVAHLSPAPTVMAAIEAARAASLSNSAKTIRKYLTCPEFEEAP